MSVEEDTELRDLISQTLETNGSFAKIRAQLRASIYLALDEDDMFQKKELLPNRKLNSILETVEGRLMFCIVREFLEHYDLDFTISVFEPESYMGSNYQYMGRYKLIQDLKVHNLEQESRDPVLLQLINLCKLAGMSVDSHDLENSSSRLNDKNFSQNMCNENSPAPFLTSPNNKSVRIESSDSTHGNALNKTFDVKVRDKQEMKSPEDMGVPSSFNNGNTISLSNGDIALRSSKFYLDETLKETPLIDFDKSIRIENINNKSDSDKSKSLIDQTIVDTDFSPPVLKDNKHSKFDISLDKLKLSSPKSDKIKAKNNLTSLSDLPPLQMCKSRSNDMLLPSLYTKEFKEKGNIRDIEKLFELEPLDNYEEDFISESEIDLTISKQEEMLKNNSLEVHAKITQKSPNVSDKARTEDCVEPSAVDNKTLNLDNSTSSGTSEEFDLNSNVDDILNSC